MPGPVLVDVGFREEMEGDGKESSNKGESKGDIIAR